jgi:pyruvate dehydrogenase E1 component beta subunit
LVIVDTGWKTGGVTAEIAATVAEKGFSYLKAPIGRVASPDVPTPAGYTLEEAFYPGRQEILKTVREIITYV